jgi:O-antigen/teichoic acid export membrane protein
MYMATMVNSSKVALNTGILYVRMLITVGISLYATRLVLSALGSSDYGVFSLIAGIIAMLSFLNTAMATSTQRFLSVYQGKKDLGMQRKVFNHSLILHLCIGIIVVLALEGAGLFIFNGLLNIAPDRIAAAKVIFHFMSCTVFFTILAVPFLGSLTANENMLWISIVNVVEILLKLGIALMLFVYTGDKLIFYGLLTAAISIVSFSLYAVYCLRTYAECKVQRNLQMDRALLKELSSFAGWNLFGSLCSLGRIEGLAVLLNVFLGTTVNAAFGIANQVAAQMSFFSLTMLRAINPQIMKSEGSNDRKRMLRLTMIASKFSFFLLAFVAIPCIFEMPAILSVWLKKVPDYTIGFCSLILVSALINQLTIGLQSGLQAIGKIKVYQAVVGTTLLLNLPVAYFFLKAGFPPYYVIVSYALIEACACVLRLTFIHRIAGLPYREYFEKVFLKELFPVLAAVLACFLMTTFFHFHFRFVLTIIGSTAVFLISIYYAGLCADEKEMILNMLTKGKMALQKRRQPVGVS